MALTDEIPSIQELQETVAELNFLLFDEQQKKKFETIKLIEIKSNGTETTITFCGCMLWYSEEPADTGRIDYMNGNYEEFESFLKRKIIEEINQLYKLKNIF